MENNTPPPPPPPDEPTSEPTPPPPRHPLRDSFKRAIGTSDQLTIQKQINRRTFVSFAAFFALGAAAWKSWFWIKDSAQSDGVQSPLRDGLNIDDKIFKHTLSPNHLVPTFPKTAAARNVRYNANIGLSTNGFDPNKWALQVTTNDNRSNTALVKK